MGGLTLLGRMTILKGPTVGIARCLHQRGKPKGLSRFFLHAHLHLAAAFDSPIQLWGGLRKDPSQVQSVSNHLDL